ncbi:MAG: DedA family protein [Minisyncoccia bacterium]
MINPFNITEVLALYGYIGVFVIVFLESGIFFPLPGDSLLFTAGILASGLGLNLGFLIPLIFIATLFGGIVGYYLGTQIEKLHKYSFFRKILSQEHINTAHKFFEKYGRFAVVFSRFVPLVRTFVPIVAGIARMDYKTFLKYSIISSLLWSTIVTLVGFFLGRTFPWVKDYLSYLVILIIFLSIVPGIYEWVRTRQKKTT